MDDVDEGVWDAAAEIVSRGSRQYRTPRQRVHSAGCRFALTYGEADWVRNVLEAGSGLLRVARPVTRLIDPVLLEDASLCIPPGVRWILRRIDVNQVLVVDET